MTRTDGEWNFGNEIQMLETNKWWRDVPIHQHMEETVSQTTFTPSKNNYEKQK